MNLLNYEDQTITSEDFESLGTGEMLTDGIINLFVAYQSQLLTQDQRDKFHLFDSIFFTLLTGRVTPNPQNERQLSPAQRRHLNVAELTVDVNIFEYSLFLFVN